MSVGRSVLPTLSSRRTCPALAWGRGMGEGMLGWSEGGRRGWRERASSGEGWRRRPGTILRAILGRRRVSNGPMGNYEPDGRTDNKGG